GASPDPKPPIPSAIPSSIPVAPPAPPSSTASSAAPPAAPQAANFPAPPKVAGPNAGSDAHKAQGGGQPMNLTTAFNGQTNALRAGSDNDSPRRQAAGDEKSRLPVNAKLIIQRGGKVGKEFTIGVAEALIGRWDADGGVFPDIDLDQDDPEAK